MERLDKRLFSLVYICTAYHSKPDDRVVDIPQKLIKWWSNRSGYPTRSYLCIPDFTRQWVSKLWIFFFKEQQRCRNIQKRLEFVNYIPNKTLKQHCHILWKLRNNTSVLFNIWFAILEQLFLNSFIQRRQLNKLSAANFKLN